MATSSSNTPPEAPKASTTRKTPAARKPAASKARKTTTPRRPSTTTSTQPKTRAGNAQHIAERAVLVPVGASLLMRDNLVSTVKGLTTKYSTRANLERELKRYERRGATARNRFERQVRKSRTRFERELRQRRTHVERTIKQNRRRVEREVKAVRRQSVGAQFEKLVSNAQELLNSAV